MNRPGFNCTDIELLLCDFVDGTLPTDQKAACEEHFAGCAACRQMLEESREVLAFVERCASVEPPPELLTRIMHQLPVARQETRRQTGIAGWFRGLLAPVSQPRFAMGMAMTILSFSMLGKCVGPLKPINPQDLNPMSVVASVDDRAHRLWNDAIKYYENLRLVYEIQTRLREWNQEDEELRNEESKTAPDVTRQGKQ